MLTADTPPPARVRIICMVALVTFLVDMLIVQRFHIRLVTMVNSLVHILIIIVPLFHIRLVTIAFVLSPSTPALLTRIISYCQDIFRISRIPASSCMPDHLHYHCLCLCVCTLPSWILVLQSSSSSNVFRKDRIASSLHPRPAPLTLKALMVLPLILLVPVHHRSYSLEYPNSSRINS